MEQILEIRDGCTTPAQLLKSKAFAQYLDIYKKQFIKELKQTFVFKENQYAGVFVYNYEAEATSSEIKISFSKPLPEIFTVFELLFINSPFIITKEVASLFLHDIKLITNSNKNIFLIMV